MSKVYYVYIHTFSNGTKYIGKGQKARAYSLSGRNIYWNNLYDKYGKPNIHILKNGLSEKESLELEITLIDIMKNVGINLCNITNGGEGSNGLCGEKAFWFGKKRDDITRNKISKALSGQNHPNYGISLSKSTKEKIGNKHRGKIISEQTRKLLIQRGQERCIFGDSNPAYLDTVHYFYHKDYGVVKSTQYNLYTTYNLHKSAVCCIVSGKRKSHKGWRIL